MNTYRSFIMLCIAILLSSCNDLLEEDLTGFGVVLLTPPANHSTASNVIQFRWEAVPRAVGYRCQIATPDFNNPVSYALDSLMTTTVFTTALAPGTYRWRIRGENANSRTDYYERTITVLEGSTLEGLTPLLLLPGDGATEASEPLVFTWQPLSGVEDHRFELRVGSSTGTLVNAQIIEEHTLELLGIGEGTYAWGIQGQNATSASLYTYRLLTVDRTAPGPPALIAPANEAVLPSTPFTLQWQSGSNSGSSSVDSLFILNGDDIGIRNLAPPGTTHTDSLGTGSYMWYVRTIDVAGNGSTSVLRSFTVQ